MRLKYEIGHRWRQQNDDYNCPCPGLSQVSQMDPIQIRAISCLIHWLNEKRYRYKYVNQIFVYIKHIYINRNGVTSNVMMYHYFMVSLQSFVLNALMFCRLTTRLHFNWCPHRCCITHTHTHTDKHWQNDRCWAGAINNESRRKKRQKFLLHFRYPATRIDPS